MPSAFLIILLTVKFHLGNYMNLQTINNTAQKSANGVSLFLDSLPPLFHIESLFIWSGTQEGKNYLF